MISSKRALMLLAVLVVLVSMVMSACSGPVGGSGGGGGGGGVGPFTIGGTVTGLTGSGLVLQNNAETLSVTGTGSVVFTFKTAIALNGTFSVTVQTQPSTPAQTCVVSNGNGKATANVTNLAVTCTTGTVAVGVTVAGLSGTGLTLQNGADFLTVPVSGTYTFPTAIPAGQNYNVTVSAQPINPGQTCTVTSGSGTATLGVAINAQITCSLGTISIGGSVSGYAGGTGFKLQNNGTDTLTITKNGSFTFPTLVPANGAYKVTVSSQPAGPNQVCTVSNGSGTATANVTNVAVVCPAVFHPIDVDVVGVLGINGAMQLQDNGGDNLMTPGNGAYTFATQIAHGSTYDVSVFVASGTQFEGCYRWGWAGTALSTPVNPIPLIDCGHDDWTWMAGANAVNQFGKSTTPLPACPPTITNTPGGTISSSTWTDLTGNLWLMTGYGYTSTSPPIDVLPDYFGELWVYSGTQPANYVGTCLNYWKQLSPGAGPSPSPRWGAVTWTNPTTGNLWLFGGQDGASLAFMNDLWEYNIGTNAWTLHGGGRNVPGVYGASAPSTGTPGGRWGAGYKLDASGNVWVFGGFGCDSSASCSNNLLNDLWTYNIGTGTWTWLSGAKTGNQAGTYGTLGAAAPANVPPGRQATVGWLDGSGNFWMFGGFTTGTNGFNDLWKFDHTTSQWTWMSGSKGATNTPGNYGTQGVAAAANTPGARWLSAAWGDTHGNLWLFGGQGYDATGTGSLGDLWEYSTSATTDPGNPAKIALNQWVWIRGPSSVSQVGIYGVAPSPIVWPHVTNNPGTRWAPSYWNTTPVQTGDQMFWMFGGEGFDATGTSSSSSSLLNDLWRYVPYP